jgi:sec-independent protein translocase protein TatA
MNLGPLEIMVVLFVGLLVFGPKRLPEVGRQVGAAMRELRKMQDTVKSELDGVMHPDLSPTEMSPTKPDAIDVPSTVDEPDHTTQPPPSGNIVEGDDGFAPPGSFS